MHAHLVYRYFLDRRRDDTAAVSECWCWHQHQLQLRSCSYARSPRPRRRPHGPAMHALVATAAFFFKLAYACRSLRRLGAADASCERRYGVEEEGVQPRRLYKRLHVSSIFESLAAYGYLALSR